MADLELFQFDASHYNEKARWALDYKRLAHRRHTLLPGPHRITALRVSKQPQVPFLRAAGAIVAGSSEIIDYLERTYPTPALYPADEKERARALGIQQWFDSEIGPEIRRAKFFDILPDAGYVVELFAGRKDLVTRALYRLAFPLVRIVMQREMRITPESAQHARERTRAALDFVAREVGTNGYLAGPAFSVADLTAAAMLALTVSLPGTTMACPEPPVAVESRWRSHWAGHPGTAWLERMYRLHRAPPSGVAA